MFKPIERLKIWLAVTLGWKVRGKLSEAIRGFQATEADGVWHLYRGFSRISDPRHKAILFTHSLEEEKHAEAFAGAYAHYSQRVWQAANYERKDLYSADEPTWKVFAYVHVGEEDATSRFRYMQQALGPGVLKEALGVIVTDEEGHVDLTHNMLVEMGATDRQISKEVTRVRLARAWEGWMRTGKQVVDVFATVMLSVIYYVVGVFIFPIARRKLAHRFVDYDNNRLKRL